MVGHSSLEAIIQVQILAGQPEVSEANGGPERRQKISLLPLQIILREKIQ